MNGFTFAFIKKVLSLLKDMCELCLINFMVTIVSRRAYCLIMLAWYQRLCSIDEF